MDMKIESLKFPSGIFTHQELATHNGATPQQVWVKYKEARENGTIVSAGERKAGGRGKPTLLWKLADETQATNRIERPVESVEVIIVTPKIIDTGVIQVIAEKNETVKLENIKPAVAPIIDVTPVVENITKTIVIPVIEINNNDVVKTPKHNNDVRVLKSNCPVCNNSLFAINDATGVKVWCGQSSEICAPQDVSHHGRNDKDASEGLLERWNNQ
jgi:predicted ArsR family transcriptional regulator